MPLTQVDQGLLGQFAQYTGFKNRLINSDMRIDQRNAGASVTATSGIAYTVDRWNCYGSQSSKFTVQQNAGSVTPPSGFTNYLGVTSSSAYTVGASEFFYVQQCVEGLNCADLGYGAVGASTVTLSFWVRSSLTGTFGGSLQNSANNYSYPFSYTISSANTWEQKTITIAGPTAGTWLTTNGVGIRVYFGLGTGSTYSGAAGSWSSNLYIQPTGSTSVVGTNGATWYVTGVQLEKGSTATSFDYRPYGTELALCQRYYQQYQSTSGRLGWLIANGPYNGTAAIFDTIIPLQVMMRASPSVSYSGLAYYNNGVGSLPNFNTIYSSTYSPFSLNIQWSGGSGGYGGVALGELHTGSGYLAASAEL